MFHTANLMILKSEREYIDDDNENLLVFNEKQILINSDFESCEKQDLINVGKLIKYNIKDFDKYIKFYMTDSDPKFQHQKIVDESINISLKNIGMTRITNIHDIYQFKNFQIVLNNVLKNKLEWKGSFLIYEMGFFNEDMKAIRIEGC